MSLLTESVSAHHDLFLINHTFSRPEHQVLMAALKTLAEHPSEKTDSKTLVYLIKDMSDFHSELAISINEELLIQEALKPSNQTFCSPNKSYSMISHLQQVCRINSFSPLATP